MTSKATCNEDSIWGTGPEEADTINCKGVKAGFALDGGGDLDCCGSHLAVVICQNPLNYVLRGVNFTVCKFYLQLCKLHTPDFCKSQLSERGLLNKQSHR